MPNFLKGKRVKGKELTSALADKLADLIDSSKKQSIQWLKMGKKFCIRDRSEVEQMIKEIFSMSYKCWKKFLKMVGFKIYKRTNMMIFVCPPAQHEEIKIQSVGMPKKQQTNDIKVPLQEISLQMNLRKMEEKCRLEEELEEKNCRHSLTRFRENANISNQLLDQVIFRVILAYGNQEGLIQGEKQKILQIIAQAQDYMFDNEKQLQNCINCFSHKAQLNKNRLKEEIHNEEIEKKVEMEDCFKFGE